MAHPFEDPDNAIMEDLEENGCCCENCIHWNKVDKCNHPENDDPQATAYSSDLCMGWERR